MIDKEEIDAKAHDFEIKTADVQRDYIFGWLLYGIFSKSGLRGRIFLKGGNALRKGYFANTRYSDDLDFGTPGEINQQELLDELKGVCAFIESKTGVKFLTDEHRVAEWYPATKNLVAELKVYDVRLYFQDFYGNADHIKIKVCLDITRFEKLLLPLQVKPLIHPYSDADAIRCDPRPIPNARMSPGPFARPARNGVKWMRAKNGTSCATCRGQRPRKPNPGCIERAWWSRSTSRSKDLRLTKKCWWSGPRNMG